MSKIIVLSADAMVGEDLEKIRRMPNFMKYLSAGACVKQVKSVYPTITYPAHTTMRSGTYPDQHGIPGNLDIQYMINPKGPIPWLWEQEAVKVEDIFTAAHRAGKTTAAVFWPVTGHHPDIDYLVDEYWTQGPEDSIHDAFARTGSNAETLEIVDRNAHLLLGNERQHPGCDYFIMACACDIIREKKPDLMMIHPANIDGMRHKYGLFNQYVDDAVAATDRWIGEVVQAAKDAGTWEETDFFLVSDHGQLDVKRCVNLNVLLAEAGLIRAEDGVVKDWKAYCLSGGMSAMVFLKDKQDKETAEKVYRLLCEKRDEGIYGIGQVFTAQEAQQQEHYAGEFSFVVETDGYTSFGDSCKRPLIRKVNNEDYRFGQATHGYLPHKGPQPILAANGPDIKAGTVLEKALLVDEAPTYAKIFGVELPQAVGHALDGILTDKNEKKDGTITLLPVDRDNFREIIKLKVSEKQSEWVADNVYSLAQAYAQPECVPFAAYAGDTPVGFAMAAFDREENAWGIWRLMVDERYQKKGYGRSILQQVIDWVKAKEDVHRLFISFEPDNTVARKLYMDMGFVDDHRDWDGEPVYRLEW